MSYNNSIKFCNYLIADVPFPPSINELYQPHKIGSRCSVGRSKKYKRYLRDVFEPFWLLVRQHGPVHFGDNVMIWVILCPPRSNCDIDNYLKCFNDCLEHVGAIENDKVISSIRVEKGPRVSKGLMRVFVCHQEHAYRMALDFSNDHLEWAKHRGDKILKQPESRLLRRAGFAAPARSPAVPVPEDTALPF